MFEDASAEVFYGYVVKIDKNERDKVKDLAESADITAELLNEEDESEEMIIGRKIEKSDIPDVNKVTPDQLMQNIEEVERTSELKKLEEKYSLETVKPTLILAGRIVP